MRVDASTPYLARSTTVPLDSRPEYQIPKQMWSLIMMIMMMKLLFQIREKKIHSSSDDKSENKISKVRPKQEENVNEAIIKGIRMLN